MSFLLWVTLLSIVMRIKWSSLGDFLVLICNYMVSGQGKFFHSWANQKSIGHTWQCIEGKLKQRLLFIHVCPRQQQHMKSAPFFVFYIFFISSSSLIQWGFAPFVLLSRSFLSWSQHINMTVFGTSWTTLFLPNTFYINFSSMPVWVPNC